MKYVRAVLVSGFIVGLLAVPRLLSAQNTEVKEARTEKVGEKFKENCRRELRATFGFNSPVGGQRGGTAG